MLPSMERTLILLKPDAICKKICGRVLARFEDAGFRVVGCKMLQLAPARLREHYAHIAGKPFYPEVEKFMSSAPVIAMVLEGESIVERMRDMLGVTDCLAAAPGTIRAEFGSRDKKDSKMRNVVHASDSVETAEREIWRFFNEDELFEYAGNGG